MIADFAAAKARKLCFWNRIITCKALHRSKSSLFYKLFTILNPKKRFRILQFLYLSCSLFRVKLFAFSFFICVLLSVLLLFVFLSLPLVCSLWHFKIHKLWECLFQNPLQLASAVIVTRQERKTSGYKVQFWRNFTTLEQKLFMPINICRYNSCRFFQIIRDFLLSFCIFFQQLLLLKCSTTIWNVPTQRFECSMVTEIAKGR